MLMSLLTALAVIVGVVLVLGAIITVVGGMSKVLGFVVGGLLILGAVIYVPLFLISVCVTVLWREHRKTTVAPALDTRRTLTAN